MTQLRRKDKPGLSLKFGVRPYHFAVDPGWTEKEECSRHLSLSLEEAKTLAESTCAWQGKGVVSSMLGSQNSCASDGPLGII